VTELQLTKYTDRHKLLRAISENHRRSIECCALEIWNIIR